MTAAFGGSGALTGGQLLVSVTIGNRGETACFLRGVPGVLLFDAGGRGIPLKLSAWTGVEPEKVLVQPRTTSLRAYSAPPGAASFDMIWPTHDGTGNCSPPALQGTLLYVQLPAGGGRLMVPVVDPRNGVVIASCGGYLSVSPFHPIQLAARASTPAPPRFAIQLDVPASTLAGKPLRYLVRLRNISERTITFSPSCPAYGEWAFDQIRLKTFAKAFYVLNCSHVGPIRSGETVAFEMEIGVPAGTAPGVFTLVWNFAEFGTGLPGRATVSVTR